MQIWEPIRRFFIYCYKCVTVGGNVLGTVEITGGIPLCGEVQIQGSKNAALPILAATALVHGTTVLYNCPHIIDITYMIRILEYLGCSVVWEDVHILRVDAANIQKTDVPAVYADKMRSSIILLGVLLARKHCARMPYPGGCVIGKRPIEMHLAALGQMGAQIETDASMLYASTMGLYGSEIQFEKNSVGATENAILAAVLSKGTTVINGAAMEPEITQLCMFLNNAGALIGGMGTKRLVIEGVSELKESSFRICADRIVAGTYLYAVAATRGEAVLHNAPVSQMQEVLLVGRQMGMQLKEGSETIYANARHANEPVPYVETKEYPGFPTDLQSVLMSALSLSDGQSIIKETIFEARFRIVEELQHMGSDIVIEESNQAVINGVKELTGTETYAKELRGGAALIVAGLAATGTTIVHDSYYVKRGYECITCDFRKLGGIIRG